MTCQCPDHNCTAVHAPFFIQSDTQRRRLCAFCYTCLLYTSDAADE